MKTEKVYIKNVTDKKYFRKSDKINMKMRKSYIKNVTD